MASKELGAIRDAWSKDSGKGRDEELARKLADSYVKAHSDEFSKLSELEIDQCVQLVDLFREGAEKGLPDMEDSLLHVETWLLHKYEPQDIGGPVKAKVRITNG